MVSEGVRVGMISLVRVGRGGLVGVVDISAGEVWDGGGTGVAVEVSAAARGVGEAAGLRVADDVGEAEAVTVAGGGVGAGPHPARLRAAATSRQARSRIILEGRIIIPLNLPRRHRDTVRYPILTRCSRGLP